MAFRRFLQRNRTEFFGSIAAFILIITGVIFPFFIPNQLFEDLPIIPDATWFKISLSFLMIGMGIVLFFYLFIIHRYYVKKRKMDYIY
ncbi:MAG: hypothetical protein EAX86_02170 [Candidatus Heimdallarchaeota archaeon]|nr:hypothetical protein [Candidatus Heimdallarchaeota archaeon]